MWKLLRWLFLSILLYGILLYGIHQYSGGLLGIDSWFFVTATQYNVFLTFGILALIFWIINGIVKSILKILTLPLRILTLGSFSLVLNMLMIYIYEFLVNNYAQGLITIHLGTIIQVFAMSLLVTVIAFLIKKII